MTKFLVFIIAFSCSAHAVSGQQKSIHDMLESKWHIANQSMSGVGDHRSLPEKTILTIRPNFTWHSSEFLEGSNEGIWREAGKNRIILSFSKGSEADLVLLEDGKLRMTRKKGLAKTTIDWKDKRYAKDQVNVFC